LQNQSHDIQSIDNDGNLGKPLAPWTYKNPELFELEYEAMFLMRWQFVGHVSDVPGIGDYLTSDIGRDNIIVLRGKDKKLRAFLNVCRHRASRILEGSGTCRGVIRCPYHGWTYQFDGSLMAVPQQENFPGLDRSEYGLHDVQLEIFHGMIYVRVKGDGPSVAEQFADTAHFFEKYGVADYERLEEPTTQIWEVNWKVAWDNYLENYHIPIGHPGLNRLLKETGEWEDLTSGVNYGVFFLKDKPSSVEVERLYQEQFHHAEKRLPDELKGKWVQFGFSPNLGIDLYPEMMDFFQLIPLGPDETMIKAWFYGHKNPTPEEIELRRLNVLINDPVNDEDRELCIRVQRGLKSHGYRPGPLSQQETAIFNFHELLREQIPVITEGRAPRRGKVAERNETLKAHS
jgi:phenylpropionate dioxygenase-like ring-hydroxylating dioxygenase large terminal subunit